MHCPHCGSHNGADAHFCADCGMPLENQGSPPLDEEATLLSPQPRDDEAKTVSVERGQEEPPQAPGSTMMMPGRDEMIAAARQQAASSPPPPPSRPQAAPVAQNQPPPASGGFDRRSLIIVGVMAVGAVCCIGATLSAVLFYYISVV